MKKLVLIFTLAIFVYSCAEKSDESTVRFGVDGLISLDSTEKFVEISEEVYAVYEKYCAVESLNLPLNKSIKRGAGENDYIFIAVAVSEKLNPVDSALSNPTKWEIIESAKYELNKVEYRRKFIKTSDCFNFRTIFPASDGKMTFVFNYLGSDSTQVRSKYDDPKYLSDKISFEK